MSLKSQLWFAKMMLKVAKILHKLGFINLYEIVWDMIQGMEDVTDEETTVDGD